MVVKLQFKMKIKLPNPYRSRLFLFTRLFIFYFYFVFVREGRRELRVKDSFIRLSGYNFAKKWDFYIALFLNLLGFQFQ